MNLISIIFTLSGRKMFVIFRHRRRPRSARYAFFRRALGLWQSIRQRYLIGLDRRVFFFFFCFSFNDKSWGSRGPESVGCLRETHRTLHQRIFRVYSFARHSPPVIVAVPPPVIAQNCAKYCGKIETVHFNEKKNRLYNTKYHHCGAVAAQTLFI